MPRKSLSGAAYTVQTGISAAGTTQGTATAIVADITKVATVGAGQGVVLPTSDVGRSMTVVNRGANALLVYPPVSSTIDALAANAAFSIAVNAGQTFYCDTNSSWHTLISSSGGSTATNLANGTTGQIPYQSAASTTGFFGPGSSGQLVRSNGAAAPSYTTATYPSTAGTFGQILRSDGTNWINSFMTYPEGAIQNALLYCHTTSGSDWTNTGAYGVLVTSAASVPSISSVLPRGIQRNTVAAISAAGTTQGTATNLTGDVSQVTTVGAGQGVQLPATVAGKIYRVANKGANALLVYPPTSSQIDALGTNVGYSLAVGAIQEFVAVTSTLWYSTTPAGGGTTTNALTMNNSGSGDASGSTFNGSAARTISYNTIGAAPLASPTFTGTPAAPTATVGTNTTQLATTAFVMAAVKQIPFTTQNTAYTLVAGDAGRGVKKTDTTARTYTINNSVFAADDVVTLGNYSSTANISVASGAGFTLYLAGTTTTGTRTIAPRGVATIVFESASVGYISGPGVT